MRSADEIRQLKEEGGLDVSLTMDDFTAAIKKTQPSVSPGDIAKYEEWDKTFASV
jgi:SpoVK/Ycf46/Vps4 family AAA+-type ATPase